MPYKDKEKQKQYMKQYDRQWREKNFEYVKQYRKQYSKQFRLDHPEYFKQWYLEHSEHYKQYYQANKEKVKQYMKQWREENPDLVKKMNRRHEAKRRELSFIPLNEYFKNSVAHHIDKERVIYIPEALHESVPHNLETGKNMDFMNEIAYGYLYGTF